MDDSELLRRAAAKIRETAQDATAGPWRSQGHDETEAATAVLGGGPEGSMQEHLIAIVPEWPDAAREEANADHIALWQPKVALAVAGWLEHEAGMAHDAENRATLLGRSLEYPHEVLEAVTVARALLNNPKEN